MIKSLVSQTIKPIVKNAKSLNTAKVLAIAGRREHIRNQILKRKTSLYENKLERSLFNYPSPGTDVTLQIRNNVDKILHILKICDGIELTQRQKNEFINYVKSTQFKVRNPEEVKLVRSQYNPQELKSEYENTYCKELDSPTKKWPVHEKDEYSKKGKIISMAGKSVEFHHIVPIKYGGHNLSYNGAPVSSMKNHSKIHEMLNTLLSTYENFKSKFKR